MCCACGKGSFVLSFWFEASSSVTCEISLTPAGSVVVNEGLLPPEVTTG